MASTKYLCFALVLLASSAVISPSSAAKGGNKAPKESPKGKPTDVAVTVIHVICATSKAIQLDIGSKTSLIPLNPGSEYQINVSDKKSNYNMMSYYLNDKYVGVDLYRPARDSGQGAIYWKAERWGFSMSYDNVNYKKMVKWESD